MQDASGTLDMAIDAVTRLRGTLRKRRGHQVRSADEQMLVKATAQAWFRSQRPALLALSSEQLFQQVDAAFAALLEYSDIGTVRDKYINHLATLRADLVRLRSHIVLPTSNQSAQQPDFKRLISDS